MVNETPCADPHAGVVGAEGEKPSATRFMCAILLHRRPTLIDQKNSQYNKIENLY